MAKEKGKPFFEGKEGKVGKPQPILGGFYGGFSQNPDRLKKQEKIIAEMANGSMLDFSSATWYSPEMTPDMWLMPKSRQETLRWVRLFYNLDPYIYSIINMHANYPFSNFTITAEDEAVTKFYQEVSFNQSFNLLDFLLQMSLSDEKFGEAITMGVRKEEEVALKKGKIKFTKWDRFILFEPEYIEVRQSFFERDPRYYLKVSEQMKADVKEAKRLGRSVGRETDEFLRNNEVLLDKDISSVMRITDASALRGTSPIQCLLRVLLFQDKVSMLKLAAIDRFRYPIEIWKIGDLSLNPPKIPNKQELTEFETFIKQAKNNPPFSIFVPPFVNYEVVGFSGQNTFDYKDDYEWIRDSILVGLGVDKSIILGDVKGWNTNKQIQLQKLIMMYKIKQDRFLNWMINHFYRPLAEANSFFTKSKDLDLPMIAWQKKLDTDTDETEEYKSLWDSGLLSTKTYYTKFKSIDFEQEQVNLKKEIGGVFDDGSRIKMGGGRQPLPPEQITPEQGPGFPGEEGGLPAPAPSGPEAPPPEVPEEELPKAPPAKEEENK